MSATIYFKNLATQRFVYNLKALSGVITMTTHRNAALDPRHFVIIKPLPILKPTGEMLQARSRTVWSACQSTREQVFWDNYHRRQWQLSRQGYRAAPWRPYEEVGQPLYLETKRLILESLGQPVEEVIVSPWPCMYLEIVSN